MTIRSSPPGARVFVDDYEIGTTPTSHNFLYYGQREIRLVKDGYETLTVMQRVPPPWYQIPPLDFVAETLVPWEIRDQRTFNYQLTPQLAAPPDALMGRAEQLRRQAQPAGAAATVSGGVPSGMAPVAPRQPEPEAIPAPPPGSTHPFPSGVGGHPVYPLPSGEP